MKNIGFLHNMLPPQCCVTGPQRVNNSCLPGGPMLEFSNLVNEIETNMLHSTQYQGNKSESGKYIKCNMSQYLAVILTILRAHLRICVGIWSSVWIISVNIVWHTMTLHCIYPVGSRELLFLIKICFITSALQWEIIHCMTANILR